MSKNKLTPPVVDRQLVTFSCFAKEKVTKEKATPVYRRCAVPCVARLVRRLRNSRYALRQSSPKSPDQSALLGGAQGRKSEKSKTVYRVGTWYPPCATGFTAMRCEKHSSNRVAILVRPYNQQHE